MNKSKFYSENIKMFIEISIFVKKGILIMTSFQKIEN